ncbi:MAG: DUF2993 domain-containing protein [Leptolyngbyaceae cyanobacterium RM2_2_4]|nr:DUF2993 domain-containing protein [Leptolyngbyaceae cyanobacterium SM1_4_3]NJN91484.1 DUF2993 domain-containing protein [Leptolyngbyaceae cyanobacterium SL_5_14]NJO49219.1 DUF2993 domain-containing protein [Leptolyngbyaceae cyanobacterium RM2_2_4]NJO66582.1 DUF2993 domain-containing protein [Leptolyngbyaceae cyanobacterium RM1_405_57]
MSDDASLEEQAFSQIVERGLSSQLNAAEALDVNIQTSILKIIQGKVDSVSIEGQGLVLQEGIRVHKLELHTDNVAVDLLNALLGQVKLNQPVNTTVQLELTEADINQAINSDYVRGKLPIVELKLPDRIVILEIKLPIQIHLLEGGRLGIDGTMQINDQNTSRQISFCSIACPRTDDHPIRLEEFRCISGEGIGLDITIAIMQKMQEWASLPYFALEGMALRLAKMDVREGKVTLKVEAQVRQVPT